MKTIVVVSTLFPNNNQPLRGVFVKERLLRLRRHFDIRVISPIPWSSQRRHAKLRIRRQDVIDGIEVWYPRYVSIPRFGGTLNGFLYALSLLIFMKKFVGRYACDAIIVHWAYPDAFGVTLINYVLKKPLFVQVHGSDINRNMKSYLKRKMISFALKRAKRVFSVAYQLQETMVALGIEADGISTIPNGVDHSAFLPRDRHPARTHLKLPLEKKIVLFVGNLVDVKGLPYLVEAAAFLLRKRSDLLFLIIGEGHRKEHLLQMIAKNQLQGVVQLLGGQPHAGIPYWMSSCDLFCLPSLNEGCPNVVIEALASGRPVVGTEVGDIPHLLRLSGGGYTVRPGDSKALAAGIEKVLAGVWDPEVLSRSVRGLTWEGVAKTICSEVSTALQAKMGIGGDCPECLER